MGFDTYRTPEAEILLRAARERFAERSRDRRLFRTEACGATLYLALAAGIAVTATAPRELSARNLGITVAALLLASRVRFPVGSAVTTATQLVFVPMLFLVPLSLVPLVLAGCTLIGVWPDLWRKQIGLTRVLAKLGDKAFALGPVLVLLLSGHQAFSWNAWPVWLLAFAAQMVFDVGSGLLRTWFAERILPREQVEMAWLYAADLCLSCTGLLVAAAAVKRPEIMLLTLPLLAMLGLFARERQQRIDHTLELSSAYRGTAMLLGDVIEADDAYTGMHSRKVVELSLAVADRLGLTPSQRLGVEFGALLHDVGKIRVSESILGKPGPLDSDELAVIRQHTIIGEEMLGKVGGTLASVGHVVRATHEHFDGDGYPDQLAGDRIPIEARVIAACDAFNAMTTDRSYRRAMPRSVAVDELRRCAGTQFDPDVVSALILELGLV